MTDLDKKCEEIEYYYKNEQSHIEDLELKITSLEKDISEITQHNYNSAKTINELESKLKQADEMLVKYWELGDCTDVDSWLKGFREVRDYLLERGLIKGG
jgi:chromosome segregation ATPase